MSFSRKIACLLTCSLILQGCAGALILGSSALATKASTDPRSIGKQIDDNTLKLRVTSALSKDEELKKSSKINVTAYNGTILLTGQASSENLIQRATKITMKVDGTALVHNQVRKQLPIHDSSTIKDGWITTKIRAQLLKDQRIELNHVKVTTENGEVFLFGAATKKESDIATNIARSSSGVTGVTRLFEHL